MLLSSKSENFHKLITLRNKLIEDCIPTLVKCNKNVKPIIYPSIESISPPKKAHVSLDEMLSLDYMLDSSKRFQLRSTFTSNGMWAFVSWKWVNKLAKWIGKRKCLEVMSGRGYLSYALKTRGVNLISTDLFTYDGYRENIFTDIYEMDAVHAVRKFGKGIDIVIMSWPPYAGDIAYRVMRELYYVNPKAIIVYIGEFYGCTADDRFHENFKQIEYDDEIESIRDSFERWVYINDNIHFGRHRPIKGGTKNETSSNMGRIFN